MTCQPVHQSVGLSEQSNNNQAMDTRDSQSNQSGSRKSSLDSTAQPINGISSQLDRLSLDLDIKHVKFDKAAETSCASFESSPLKVTVPTQETVLLTGVQPDTQILIHKMKKNTEQSTEEKYKPIELRVFASDEYFDIDQIKSVVIPDEKKGFYLQDSSMENPQRSNCFMKMQEENTVPMKKRFVVEQNGEQNNLQNNFSYPTQSPPQLSQFPPQFKRRIPDGWGYLVDKRQRYGVLQTHEEIPLNLKLQ